MAEVQPVVENKPVTRETGFFGGSWLWIILIILFFFFVFAGGFGRNC
jgi:hypothetical protein